MNGTNYYILSSVFTVITMAPQTLKFALKIHGINSTVYWCAKLDFDQPCITLHFYYRRPHIYLLGLSVKPTVLMIELMQESPRGKGLQAKAH